MPDTQAFDDATSPDEPIPYEVAAVPDDAAPEKKRVHRRTELERLPSVSCASASRSSTLSGA
jgi:hypothetical protein